MCNPRRMASSKLLRVPALSLVLVLSACSGQAAKEVAYGTLKLTNSYEMEIDKKVAAEKAFYKQQVGNLRRFLIGFNELPVEVEDRKSREAIERAGFQGGGVKLESEPLDEIVKASWLWGYIRTTIDQGALRAASQILHRPNALAYSTILDLVEGGLRTDQEALALARRKQAELAAQVVQNLQPIEKQTKRLTALKKGLTNLSTTSGAIFSLDDILKLAGTALQIPSEDAGGTSGAAAGQ